MSNSNFRKSGSSPPAANHQAALSIISVCLASLSMTVANKYIVSGRNFDMNFLMLAVQSAVSAGAVLGAKKVIDFPDFDANDAKSWSPVSFGLVALMYSGSKALQHLSIPVYVIFKNLTIILIAYGEMIWFGGIVTRLELLSFVLMILSSVIAASANIMAYLFPVDGVPVAASEGSSALGYLWVVINCMVSAAYILGMRKKIKSMNFTDWQTSFYNNTISIPILIVASVLVEGWNSANFTKNFPEDSRTYLIVAMILSGGVAVFISFCSAWCIRVTSSTTYSMIGALNKLPVAVSGMIFFHDPVNFRSVSAVSIGFGAGCLYTKAKQLSNEHRKKQEALYAPIPGSRDTADAISLLEQGRADVEEGKISPVNEFSGTRPEGFRANSLSAGTTAPFGRVSSPRNSRAE